MDAIPTIGDASHSSAVRRPHLLPGGIALKKVLRELGNVDGKNIAEGRAVGSVEALLGPIAAG